MRYTNDKIYSKFAGGKLAVANIVVGISIIVIICFSG